MGCPLGSNRGKLLNGWHQCAQIWLSCSAMRLTIMRLHMPWGGLSTTSRMCHRICVCVRSGESSGDGH
eukprot:11066353-Prorocentrum_lima.AAC.1